MSRRRAIEGETLPNALAALARTRERTLVEIDENVAAQKGSSDTTTSRVKVSRDDDA